MSKISLIFLAILVVGGLVFIAQSWESSPQQQEPIGGGPSTTEELEDTNQPSRKSTITPTTTRRITPTHTPREPVRNITVTSPRAGQTVDSPLTVKGQARTFEQAVSFRLSEKGGRVLAEEYTTAQAPEMGMFGPYEVTIQYPQPTQREGVLEVFQSSAKDGSEIDKVIINVLFENAEQRVPTP